MSLTIYRKAHFNAAHRLYRKDWSDAINKDVFGKCSNAHFHGHNYELEVGITGDIDPETGFVINLNLIKKIIFEEIEEYFDHKNLNLEVPEFENLNPTVENIAVVIWNRLRVKLDAKFQLSI
ncbi:MAG: 6-carboxytetrahydropterin synthase, partial [Flavobacteriaceae bacterium]|nr:6-carboxytetrahydropterin synthase [Flavobacteriaceae bacterium]